MSDRADSDAAPGDFTRDLVRWSETLAAIARTGMGFTQSLYERERFEEVLHVAADIKVAADEALEIRREQDHFVQEWMQSIGEGVPGYVTPKVAIGAVVGNDKGEILLVRRADSGVWLYPTGWADVGYSPAEVAVKEVAEETGIECRPTGVVSVTDGQRRGFTRFAMYMILFHCVATGGDLNGHPLETSGVGWFARDALPTPLAGQGFWAEAAFAAIDAGDGGGASSPTTFDAPRAPMWRGEHETG
ncbi:MAG: NUDIX hydrolase N-terminal domain-containing protein [Ilumatobacteraceae bacterium]